MIKNGLIKNFQSYKRDPVSAKADFYHLSSPVIAGRVYQPTRSGLCTHNLVSNFYPDCVGTGVYLAFQPIRFTRTISHLIAP